MADFSVTGIVTIDNTQSLLSIDEVQDKAEAAAQRLMMLRRKTVSTLSLVNGMITQAYSALKGLVAATGGMINPMFDAMFTMISSVVSTALAAAIMLMSTLHPALIAVGVTLLVVSLELSIKAQMDLAESKKIVENFTREMQMNIRRSQVSGVDVTPFRGF